jgi:amino acid transporter
MLGGRTEVVAKMKWIMLVSGVLTLTMVYAAVAPEAALRSLFGDALEGPLAEIVVRNWGVLIALVGGMLIYGAFHAHSRRLVLIVAGLSKVAFIALVLTYGGRYLGQQVGVSIAIDLVMVLLFVVYLVASRHQANL